MAQVCTPQGEHCYDCDDYAGAFACLEKIRISDMAVASELEVTQAIESECEQILVAAEFVPCNGTPFTQAVNLQDIITSASVTAPIGATFWTPLDFGDQYGSCWYKFNTDLVIARLDFADFFTAAGIAGDTYTIPGMQGKMAMGAGTNYCDAAEIVGAQDSEITLDCENLPRCSISINDPGHKHLVPTYSSTDVTQKYEVAHTSDPENWDYREAPYTERAVTGISASHQVGENNNGTPVPVSVTPWSVCGTWYIKLSNNCA